MNHQKQAHLEIEHIFRTLLPQSGLIVREGQTALCHTMLDRLFAGGIALCEAGVGIGKTYSYLIACILLQKFGQASSVTVSTSSIALQNAIFRDYVPFLSQILLQHQVISKPVRAIVRKGKSHFVCDFRLQVRLQAIHNKPKNEQQKLALLSLKSQLDMDVVPFLSNFDRRQVCVPKSCSKACILYEACRYHHYLKRAQSPDIFIQICNHNYLLADAAHRQQGLRPLLKDYRALVIDEAHKLPDAAKQINEQRFSLEKAKGLCVLLAQEGFPALARKFRGKFDWLLSLFSSDFTCCRTALMPTDEQTVALHDCLKVFRQAEKVHPRLSHQTVFLLDEAEQLLRTFLRPDQRYILYVEYDPTGRPALCAADPEPAVQLKKNLWAQEIPTILTSGTLAVGGCFGHIEKVLGLSSRKQTHFTAPSPFSYQLNCLLYIPENTARRIIGTKKEALYLVSQIQQLILATHGHTLVLFTSYTLMNAVYHQLKDSILFPILVVQKHFREVFRQFKELPNAVLFAAGSCWEGMDFPGDQVSSLIIPRLPFPVPDSLHETEQERFPNLTAYIEAVIVPEMQQKLRQGFGRAIRTETDTCVISILDSRSSPGGRYRQAVLDALPEMPITSETSAVRQFIREKKAPDYFLP